MTRAKSRSKRPKRKRRGRREKSLAGTNLYRDVDSDMLIWRRTHPLTKKRIKRSTGFKVLELAQVKVREFEDTLDREVAGLQVYDSWARPLAPLVVEYIRSAREHDNAPQERWLLSKEKALLRALRELRLERAADLTKVGALDARLRRLKKKDSTLRRRYQDPLKQFSKWLAENGRYLEQDPLAVWAAIPYQSQDKHRAFDPDEVARAFVAADWLDAIHGREPLTRLAFTILLVTAPRVMALTSRDVKHFLRSERRIDFGAGCGKKGRGRGHLDPDTADALAEYLGKRSSGPLLLSPRGKRMPPRHLLKWWQEAFGLGLVWELWPDDEKWSLELAHCVNQSLIRGFDWIPAFGNPNVVTHETKRARHRLRSRVGWIVQQLREPWQGLMLGVTLHAFRHTHETWARARDVDQLLINLQVGWRAERQSDSFGALRVANSSTGLAHYLDARSKLFEAGASAAAVREVLDQAIQALEVSWFQQAAFRRAT